MRGVRYVPCDSLVATGRFSLSLECLPIVNGSEAGGERVMAEASQHTQASQRICTEFITNPNGSYLLDPRLLGLFPTFWGRSFLCNVEKKKHNIYHLESIFIILRLKKKSFRNYYILVFSIKIEVIRGKKGDDRKEVLFRKKTFWPTLSL